MKKCYDYDFVEEAVVRFNDDGTLHCCYLSNNPLDYMGPEEYQDAMDFLIEWAKNEPPFDYGQSLDDSCYDNIWTIEQNEEELSKIIFEEMYDAGKNIMKCIEFSR